MFRAQSKLAAFGSFRKWVAIAHPNGFFVIVKVQRVSPNIMSPTIPCSVQGKCFLEHLSKALITSLHILSAHLLLLVLLWQPVAANPPLPQLHCTNGPCFLSLGPSDALAWETRKTSFGIYAWAIWKCRGNNVPWTAYSQLGLGNARYMLKQTSLRHILLLHRESKVTIHFLLPILGQL